MYTALKKHGVLDSLSELAEKLCRSDCVPLLYTALINDTKVSTKVSGVLDSLSDKFKLHIFGFILDICGRSP